MGLASGHEAVDRPLQLSGAAGDLRGDDRDDLFAGLFVDLLSLPRVTRKRERNCRTKPTRVA
ncbi:MAG: hypothetical protein IH898_08735 [Planctomycetes bacterium]|nr:hypothetical protein [Planctomycetota bacterium]